MYLIRCRKTCIGSICYFS